MRQNRMLWLTLGLFTVTGFVIGGGYVVATLIIDAVVVAIVVLA